jgi:chromate reductase
MSDAKAISVLGICGSLRKASFNRAALNTAIELKPAGMSVTIADISQIPLYNEDVRVQGFPPPVETLRQQIKAADALLFACPEYNYSMSGVLKNAIDWASRPFPDNALAHKPVAVMGASTGIFGAVWAQAEVRKALQTAGADVLDNEVPIGQAHAAFTAQEQLGDPELQSALEDLLEALLSRAGATRGDASIAEQSAAGSAT